MTSPRRVDETQLMKPTEVAEAFNVTVTTVRAWAKKGKLQTLMTLGGHRRFLTREVEALLARSEPRQ